jgi:hypothetical protein
MKKKNKNKVVRKNIGTGTGNRYYGTFFTMKLLPVHYVLFSEQLLLFADRSSASSEKKKIILLCLEHLSVAWEKIARANQWKSEHYR